MKNKKEIIIWADDDWMNYNKKEYRLHLVEGGDAGLGIFHYKKYECYEGIARKVKITIEEI